MEVNMKAAGAAVMMILSDLRVLLTICSTNDLSAGGGITLIIPNQCKN